MNTKKLLTSSPFFALVLVYRQPLAELLAIVSDQQAVSEYLKSYGAMGPVVLFLLMVAQVFVAVIPGHALMVTAGYVYGGARPLRGDRQHGHRQSDRLHHRPLVWARRDRQACLALRSSTGGTKPRNTRASSSISSPSSCRSSPAT